jgi:hypothetical protein
LNFENDEGGKRAMERSIDLAHARFETDVDFRRIPKAGLKDPADIVSEKREFLTDIVSRSVPQWTIIHRHPVAVLGYSAKNRASGTFEKGDENPERRSAPTGSRSFPSVPVLGNPISCLNINRSPARLLISQKPLSAPGIRFRRISRTGRPK